MLNNLQQKTFIVYLENEAHLLALKHECGAVGFNAIITADPTKHMVDDAKACILRRHEKPDLRHNLSSVLLSYYGA